MSYAGIEYSIKHKSETENRHEGIDSNPTKKDDRVGYDLFKPRIQSGYATAEGSKARDWHSPYDLYWEEEESSRERQGTDRTGPSNRSSDLRRRPSQYFSKG